MSFPIHKKDYFSDPLSRRLRLHSHFVWMDSVQLCSVFSCSSVHLGKWELTKWLQRHSWKCKFEPTSKWTAVENCCSELLLKSKNVTLWQILSLTLIFPHLCACLRLSFPPGLYRHHEDIENMVQVLEVPLYGGKASVVLLLPFHVESLARLEKLLTPELLSKWLEKTNITSMSISLPRANITSTLSLQVSTTNLTDFKV